MFKIDQVEDLFDCDLCQQLLIEPISLRCGNTICKRHLDYQLNDKSSDGNSIKCMLCHKKHTVPEEGFVVNKLIQNALHIKFNTLKLNPVYDECKKEIEASRERVAKIETMKNDPEIYIYEYFEEIKRKVDLRREDLKLKIDDYSNDIIKSINTTQVVCTRLSKDVNKFSADIEESKKELDKLIHQFDTIENDEKKFGDIKKNVSGLNQKFSTAIDRYKDSLIRNKEYSFSFKEQTIEDVFGCFSVYGKDKLVQNLYETKNLLKNPNGNEGFKHWIPIDLHREIDMKKLITGQREIQFDGWSIESGDKAQEGMTNKDKAITCNFVTSFTSVGKAQIIDLNAYGVNIQIVEENGQLYWPRLEVSEKFASRFDCGINYHLRVYLVTKKYEICDRFVFKKTQNAEANWNEAHNIREITDDVRYIVFVHGGSDTKTWAGLYGPKMCNGSVVIRSYL